MGLIKVQMLLDPSDRKSKLTINDKQMTSLSGVKYIIETIEGVQVPNLIYPRESVGSDKEFQEQYDTESAVQYDQMSKFLFEMVFEDEEESRRQLVESLDLKAGDKVLEVSTGTGSNVYHMLQRVGETGEIHLLDLSKAMLTEAIKKFKDQKNVYYLGNGSNLPFADNSFDALLHVGGINTFTDIEGALQEFARVTKQGGKILVCDEGIADHLLNTSYGKIGVQFNTLYKSKPPIDKLPSTARNVRVSYVLGGFFYCIEFIKGREYEFNLEAIMPGQNITLGEFFKKNKAKLDSI